MRCVADVEEVLQEGYRLVLLPKLAYYAMWDGHEESFAVPRATPKGAEVALPIGSYTSAPDVGTDTPNHPSATMTDPHGRPAPRLASLKRAELQLRNWQPGLAWQAPDVRNTASAVQAAVIANRRVLPAPPAPIGVLPLLALPCLSSLTLPLLELL